MNTHQQLFTGIFGAWIAGSVAAYYGGMVCAVPFGILFLAGLGMLLYSRRRVTFAAEKAVAAGLYSGVAAIAVLLTVLAVAQRPAGLRPLIGQQVTVTVMPQSRALPTARGQKVMASLPEMPGAAVMLYLPADAVVRPGMACTVTGQVRPLHQATGGWAAWLERNGVTAAFFAQEYCETGPAAGIEAALLRCQDALAQQADAAMPDPRTAALARAMFLGDRSGLDTGTKTSFSLTGLSHILAISGLHIMLLCGLLLHVTAPLVRSTRLDRLRKGGILVLLLAYCLLSGGSPAVMRAGIMVAVGLLAEIGGWRVHRLNLLAFTAFCLCVWNPLNLLDPGFQLSVAAVAGIQLAARPLQVQLARRFSRLPALVREGLAVTLVAQAATAPLILWHFGSFPTWFLVSNLLVLPLADVATNVGFAAFFLCWVPGLRDMLFGMLDFLLWSITWLSGCLASLPAPQIRSFSSSEPGLWILTGMLLLLTLALRPWELRRLPRFGRVNTK